jgi:hypothetical protein
LGVNTKQLKTLGWFGLTVHFLHALKEFQANDAYFNASEIDFGDQNFIDILYQAIREAPARDLFLPRVPANLLAGTRSTDHLAKRHQTTAKWKNEWILSKLTFCVFEFESIY